MSRVGKRPVPIPAGVTVVVDDERVQVKGPKGELSTPILGGTRVRVENGEARRVGQAAKQLGLKINGLDTSMHKHCACLTNQYMSIR